MRAPPINYGVTADTGGHIGYVLEAAMAQAARPEIERITILTRLFEQPGLDPVHALDEEVVAPKLRIRRLRTSESRYLDKSRLGPELPGLADAAIAFLDRAPPRAQIVHAHFSDAAAIAERIRDRLGIPFVYTPHSLGIDKRRHLRETVAATRIAQERRAIARSDAIVVSSADEANRQIPAYAVDVGDRLRVIAAGAPSAGIAGDAARGRRWLANWLAAPQRPIVLAVARPVARKNLIVLPRAFARHPALREAANLVIVAGNHHSAGLGSEERGVLAQLHHEVASAGLGGVVALPPEHDATALGDLYAAAAASGGVFVNPALHEPYGLTLLEAACAGLPVVATRNGGPVDILSRVGHGLLIDPRDPADIAEKCLRVLTDRALRGRLVDACARNIEGLSWSGYAAETTRLYRSLAARGGRRGPAHRAAAASLDAHLPEQPVG